MPQLEKKLKGDVPPPPSSTMGDPSNPRSSSAANCECAVGSSPAPRPAPYSIELPIHLARACATSAVTTGPVPPFAAADAPQRQQPSYVEAHLGGRPKPVATPQLTESMDDLVDYVPVCIN